MNVTRVVWALIKKDLRAEVRGFESTLATILFAIVTLMVFNFAIQAAFRISTEDFRVQMGGLLEAAYATDSHNDSLVDRAFVLARQTRGENALAGVLWISILLAAVLGLNRSSAAEQESDCLLGLLLAPVDRAYLYMGKAITNFILLAVVDLVVVPVFGILYRIDLFPILLPLAGLVALGTLGLALAGTLFSYVAAQTKYREVLLPLLLFPITVPILIGATLATSALLSGDPGPVRTWTWVLLVMDVVVGVLSFLLFEQVVED